MTMTILYPIGKP